MEQGGNMDGGGGRGGRPLTAAGWAEALLGAAPARRGGAPTAPLPSAYQTPPPALAAVHPPQAARHPD